MATRLKMSSGKLPFIYNISQRVGFGEPNLPDDIQLLQAIIGECVLHINIGQMKPHPSLNGIFDTVTGFWLFQLQKMVDAKVDGRVTPVTGADGMTGGKKWTLYGLNEILFYNAPYKYQKLHEDLRLSASLRNSIKP